MHRSLLIGVILLLAVVVLVLGLFWEPDKTISPEIAQKPQGGDFTLQSSTGPVHLKEFRGKVVVLFFGYTMCPDVCPTSMGQLSLVLNDLPEEELAQVQGLFISVDPERDTLERLQTYGQYFHSRIQGVTGTLEQVAAVAKMYGAAFRKSEQQNGEGYSMDHTADLYLIDRDGSLHSSVRHGAPSSELLQLLRQLLSRD